MNTPAPKPTVLIVDDTPDSLGLLNLLLKDHYRVKAALDGERALTLANAEPRPDLILLDIMMPGIDGFEVCRRLKANPPTAEIPVIFLTARSQVEDEQTGFDVGGVDYILKPVSPPIVEARVRTHLQNKAARDILKDQNAFLEAEVKKRTAEVLAAAEMKAQLAGLQQELEVARRMQASILPRALPPRREVDVAGVMIPAKEVGGDFYDYFLVDERRLGIVVADVCGKGVPAAFFMAITRTLLRAHASSAWEPADCLTRLNEQLAAENDQMMFVTLFFGVLDLQTGELRYANAGHNPPLVRSHDGTLRPLDGNAGAALAIIDDYELDASRTELARGDTLLLFTDGITEAFDVDQQAFGDDRLERLLRAMPADTTPSACAARIVAAVRTFARGEPQSDDITCVVLRYHGE